MSAHRLLLGLMLSLLICSWATPAPAEEEIQARQSSSCRPQSTTADEADGSCWASDGSAALQEAPPSGDPLGSRQSAEVRILDFPIIWQGGWPYNKHLPEDKYGDEGGISCVHLARAMIIRYWSLQQQLDPRGRYWYWRNDTGELLEADFDVPFEWDLMPQTLAGLPEDDPGVDAVARFIRDYCVASRTNWPWLPESEGGDWYYRRSNDEAFAKSFGFDVSGYQFIQFGEFLSTHSWDELHAIVRAEIDDGGPVYLRLEREGVGHSVVITGYRVEGGATEYYINFGHHGGYSLDTTYRLEDPIGVYDVIEDRHVVVGMRPAQNPERLPLWTKLDEVRNTEYDAWPSGCVIPTDEGFLCAYPVGPLDGHDLLLMRTDRFGRRVGESVTHHREGRDLYHARLAFSGANYGLAWMERTAGGQAFLHFNILDEAGNMTLADDVVVGELHSWRWRPPFSVEWTGTAFLIVWHAGPTEELRLTLLDTDGHYVAQTSTLWDYGFDPDVVCFSDRFAVAFSTWDAIWFAVYDYSGRLLIGPWRVASGAALFTPKVAYDGSGYGIVWEDNTLDSRGRVLLVRLSESGGLMTGEPLEVNLPDHEPVARCPSIAYINDHYHISYTQMAAWYAQVNRDLEVVTRLNTAVAGWHWVDFVSMAQQNEHLLLVQAWQFSDAGSVEFEACHLYTCPLFGDVPTTFWSWADIEACYFAGIVGGYGDGLYHPEYTVSRDQMAVFISRSICTPTGEVGMADYVPPDTPTFTDVPTDFWCYKYIEYAVEYSIVGGYGDGTYQPQVALDRGQMAVFIARAMAGDDGSVPDPTGDPSFPDVPADFWSYRHIEYIAEQGVAGGYHDGLYHPEYPVTRDQMAVFICRAFELPT